MKIKRVLLIDPPVTRPVDMLADKVRIGLVAPLGLAYIAAVLETQGIEVKILDCVAEGQSGGMPYEPKIYLDWSQPISSESQFCATSTDKLIDYNLTSSYYLTTRSGYPEIRYGLTDNEIRIFIERFQPALVGVSCLFSNKAWDAHNVCRIVKQISPRIITVMGGAHPTSVLPDTIDDNNVDYVIPGEGENGLLKLIRWGPCQRGAIRVFTSADSVDLDRLPLPARHLLNMPTYLYSESPHSGLKRQPVANISTSRGCPGRCEFCAIRCLFGERYRTRSPENVLAEIEHLINAYHIKELHFEDDNLTANKKRAMAIFQGIIDRKWDLSLSSPSGLAVFALDEELLDKMKEAGYYSISLAIESGVPEVLRLMHKKVDLVKAKRLIKYARSIGLKTKAFFILGYPGETKETMRRTVNYAGELGSDWCLFFPATPLPGTEMDRRVRANGWLVDPNMDYRYYFFRANIRTPEFDPEFVLNLEENANRQINFEHNVNMREGRFERAREDFSEVVKLYPHLDFAQKALKEAQNHVS